MSSTPHYPLLLSLLADAATPYLRFVCIYTCTYYGAAQGPKFVPIFTCPGGTRVSGLTRGLATLPPKVDPGAFSGQRQGWKTPKRTPWQCTASVCSGSALLGDLLGVSRSRERERVCPVDFS